MVDPTRLRLGALALLTATAGCTPAMQAPAPGAPPVTMQQLSVREAGVAAILPRCPRADRADDEVQAAAPLFGAALAAVAPVVVDLAVSAVREHLQRVAEEREGRWTATGAGQMPASAGCLVVARGRLGQDPGAGLAEQGRLSRDDLRQIGLASPPAFYFEARIEATPRAAPAGGAQAGTDLVLRPQVVHFARTAARRGVTDPKAIAMVVVLRGTPMPNQPTSSTASTGADAVFALNIGAMRPGQEIMPASLPAPSLPTVDNPHPLADLAQRATVPQRSGGALNVGVFVTESASPDRALQLVNAVLERQATALQTALTKVLQDAIKEAMAPAAPAAGR